jgi:hypothetical protein
LKSGIAWAIVMGCFAVGYASVAAVVRHFKSRADKGAARTGHEQAPRFETAPDFPVDQGDDGMNRQAVGDVEAHYRRILGVSSRASEFEIQANYRLLMSRYDVNKLSQLGEDFKRLGDQKTKEISMAYEYLRQKHNFR